MGGTRIYAHRGASAFCIENTMEAFKLAVEQRADGIELDVQLARDGTVVVLHDETVDRVWNGSGAVKDFTYAQLKELHARKRTCEKSYIPSLIEVLHFILPLSVALNIELKTNAEPYTGIEQKTVELIHQLHMQERVVYSSFNHESLLRIKTCDPNARIGLLYSSILVRPWDYAKAVGAYAIHPNINSMRVPNLVKDCHQRGVDVNVWTVDAPEWIRFCMEQDVDGIITNRPDIAVYQSENKKQGFAFENNNMEGFDSFGC